MILGVIVFFGGIFTGVGILYSAEGLLKDAAQLSLPGQKGYLSWQDTSHMDAAPLLHTIYFYNITNSRDIYFLNSAPQVQEVGPYTFREYCKRLNVQVRDNNEALRFNEMCWKEFVPSLSIDANGRQLTEDDPITHVNVQLFGILHKVKQLSHEIRLKGSVVTTVLSRATNAIAPAFGGSSNLAEVWGNYTARPASAPSNIINALNNGLGVREIIQNAASINIRVIYEFSRFAGTNDPIAMAFKNNAIVDIQLTPAQSLNIINGTYGIFRENVATPSGNVPGKSLL